MYVGARVRFKVIILRLMFGFGLSVYGVRDRVRVRVMLRVDWCPERYVVIGMQ